MSLRGLFQSRGVNYYPTDKDTRHNYLGIYDALFRKFQDNATLIEIGIDHGGSLRLFADWFRDGRIIGYDITSKNISVPLGRAEVILKDCNSFKTNEFKNFAPDIIIDDGSHVLEDQLWVVKICYPQLKPGGMLIIEDIQDIDNHYQYFKSLEIPFLEFDMRGVYDNVLFVFPK